MNTSSFLLVLAVIFNASSARGGEILERWHWRNPLPQGNALHNVAFVNGRYVATGEMGTLLTSNDGTNWVSQKAGTPLELRDCAYGAGKYVVVGDFGTVLTSTDAQTWTSQYAGTFYSLNGVTFAARLFVAVGEQTTILTSADGVTWVQRSSGSHDLSDVIQADGLFIASGGNAGVFCGHGTSLILTSPDASVWTYRVLKSGTPFTSLAWGGGQTAAVTRSDFGVLELWTSANGVDWQPKPLPSLYYSLTVRRRAMGSRSRIAGLLL